MNHFLSDDVINVYNNIPDGIENALTLHELSRVTGIEERSLKKRVQELRKAGYPIVSSSQGGYYIPREGNLNDIQGAERFCRMQSSQAVERFQSVKPVKKWLRNLDQMTIGDDHAY